MLRRPAATDPFERLEKECNDDFRLLADLGPSHFDAEHLLDLHRRTKERLALFERRQKLAMTIGATGTGWVFLGALCRFSGFPWVMVAAYAVAGLSFSAFFFIIFWQKKTFESRGELDYAIQSIETELKKRAAHKTA